MSAAPFQVVLGGGAGVPRDETDVGRGPCRARVRHSFVALRMSVAVLSTFPNVHVQVKKIFELILNHVQIAQQSRRTHHPMTHT